MPTERQDLIEARADAGLDTALTDREAWARVSDLTWLILLVREFAVHDRVDDGFFLGGDVGREGLLGAVDLDRRRPQRP